MPPSFFRRRKYKELTLGKYDFTLFKESLVALHADLNGLFLAIFNNSNLSQVCLKYSLCSPIGVRHIMTKHSAFSAYIAPGCHFIHLLMSIQVKGYFTTNMG